MKKKVSLKDIAQKVGVSTALVSYVLNNQKTGRISKEVASRIKDTAVELNYSINHIARSLKTNKTFTIGLIVADISNSFSATLARIIEDEAEQHNYTVLFGSSDECGQKSIKLINLLLNHQVDGFILALAENAESQVTFLQEREVPFVLIDRYFPGTSASYVAIDNFKAGQNITQHLIDTGNKRIGIVTYKTNLFNLQERKRGYLQALEENNIKIDDQLIKEVNASIKKQEVGKAIDELLALEEPVDAIVFANNNLSTLGLKHLNTLPIKVPKDLAIASFDESDAAELFYAPLTHIKQPLAEMGQKATQILLELIGRKSETVQLNLDAELVVRKSSVR